MAVSYQSSGKEQEINVFVILYYLENLFKKEELKRFFVSTIGFLSHNLNNFSGILGVLIVVVLILQNKVHFGLHFDSLSN